MRWTPAGARGMLFAMASRDPDSEGFLELWPTLMLRQRRGAEKANPLLAQEIQRLEAENPQLTTDYREQNFLGAAHPAIAWLRDCVNRAAVNHLRRQGIDYKLDWSLQAWPNVNRLGDYHDPHNHPHAYLSGTYYVAVPKSRAELKTRADVRPGCISFYDPRGAANMTAIKGDGQIEAEYTLLPEAGELLLWPAFLLHFVHPNLSEEPRLSISFNVVLKRSADLLPEQG